jgi:outer membrane protein assembly factor BamB
MLTPKGLKKREVLPPSLRQTPGNKHTTLATPGYIWVTNTGTQMLERINTTTLEVVMFASGGGTPAGIAFDGTHLYVSHFSSGNITKMTTTGEVLASYQISSGLHQIVFDGVDLWVTSYYEGKIYKLSTSGTVLFIYDSGRYPVDLTVADNKIWVGLFNFTFYPFGAGGLLKLNNNGTLNAEYPIVENPLGIDFGDNHIWTANFLTGDVFKVNASNGTVVLTFNTGIPDSAILHLSYSTYGNYILITISKDYSSYNLPNSENVVQIRSAATGALIETVPVGIDPRNVSIDEFHWGYVAGYGDGTVTRFPLPAPGVSYDIFLHFDTFPFTNSGDLPVTITAPETRFTSDPARVIEGSGSAISNRGSGNLDQETIQVFSTDAITLGDQWTIRFKATINAPTMGVGILTPWTGSAIESVSIISAASLYVMQFTAAIAVPITPGIPQLFSIELFEGSLYIYLDGVLKGTQLYNDPLSGLPIPPMTLSGGSRLFSIGGTGNDIAENQQTIIDELIFLKTLSLSHN